MDQIELTRYQFFKDYIEFVISLTEKGFLAIDSAHEFLGPVICKLKDMPIRVGC